jgi:uncharacterized DUF497 family protein
MIVLFLDAGGMNEERIDMDFEWYSEKEQYNIEHHNGINLDVVQKVFDDPFRIQKYDETHSGLEDRWQTLGKVDNVIFVVYTERGTKYRVISARKAEPEERRIYYGTSKNDEWFIP